MIGIEHQVTYLSDRVVLMPGDGIEASITGLARSGTATRPSGVTEPFGWRSGQRPGAVAPTPRYSEPKSQADARRGATIGVAALP